MAKGQLYHELPFPRGGVNTQDGFTHQANGTIYDALNVRSMDPIFNADRGGQRGGHTRYLAGTLNGSAPIQNINHVIRSATSYSTGGPSVRTNTLVAVAGGTVKTASRGGVYGAVTNGAAALSTTTPFISSTVLLSKIYYADGLNWKYYDPATNTVVTMVATFGALPIDSNGYAPRLITSWRGRLVWSGLLGDPQNWFMSRQFVPLDYDYSPAFTTASQAVAGNNCEAGLVPDIINTLVSYSDDVLAIGGDHSLWQLTGDPMAGGQIDRISDTVGMAFGDSWCKDNLGNVWFVGSRGGLYVFRPTPGQPAQPERVSALRVDDQLMRIDFAENIVRLGWDDSLQAVMFYITPIAGGPTTNWCFDTQNKAFWPDTFGNPDHNCTATHLMDGDAVDDRVLLLGRYDGAIQFLDWHSKQDDGTAIESHLKIGPIQMQGAKARITELISVLGEQSDKVKLEIFTGHSAEHAYNAATPRFTRTIGAGRSEAIRPGTTGQALFIKLSNSKFDETWQFEALYAVLAGMGLPGARQL